MHHIKVQEGKSLHSVTTVAVISKFLSILSPILLLLAFACVCVHYLTMLAAAVFFFHIKRSGWGISEHGEIPGEFTASLTRTRTRSSNWLILVCSSGVRERERQRQRAALTKLTSYIYMKLTIYFFIYFFTSIFL